MHVIKRNGEQEEVSLQKVQNRLVKLATNLDIDIIPIAQKVINQIYDGIHTTELDEFAAALCVSLVTVNPDYGKLASYLLVSNNHKNTSPSFSEAMNILYNNTDGDGKHVPLIAEDVHQIIMKNKDKLNATIKYDRDYDIDFFGFKTLERAYLIRVKDNIIERPQHMYMRVALGIHKTDIRAAIETYNLMSERYFTHATPTLFHSGTPFSQMLSCFLLGGSRESDSIKGIYKLLGDCASISQWAGGIGVNIHHIRSKGALIRGTNGKSNGIIPMLRVFNETARYVDQGGGKRKGSFAIYIEPHHPDIEEFLKLRFNQGKEELRCRDLFTALWVSDLFMKQVENDGDWYYLDDDECPGLSECWGEEYEKLYWQYVNAGKYRKVIRKISSGDNNSKEVVIDHIKARDLWTMICESQIETGTPYILFKDSVNRKSNQQNLGTIRSSNLCAEIVEYSDDKEYACCTLASLSLSSFVVFDEQEDGSLVPRFDHQMLSDVCRVVITNLDKVIDLNVYPVPETKLSNERHRPLGLGVQGLYDTFMKMRYPFESDEARQLNREIFETIYYASMKTSIELAKQKGAYSTFKGSPLSQGKFQFDLWGEKPATDRYDWDELRHEVIKHGARNSLLIALMPTASTSQILGNVESFEPINNNIFTRRTLAGEFVVINQYLVRDLIKLGVWSIELKNEIIANNGSVQGLKKVPKELQELYKTVWEVKQKSVIDMSADRGPFICQTQSLNLHFKNANQKLLSSALTYGWKRGLKTGSYYIRSQSDANAIQFTISKKTVDSVNKQTGRKGISITKKSGHIKNNTRRNTNRTNEILETLNIENNEIKSYGVNTNTFEKNTLLSPNNEEQEVIDFNIDKELDLVMESVSINQTDSEPTTNNNEICESCSG